MSGDALFTRYIHVFGNYVIRVSSSEKNGTFVTILYLVRSPMVMSVCAVIMENKCNSLTANALYML